MPFLLTFSIIFIACLVFSVLVIIYMINSRIGFLYDIVLFEIKSKDLCYGINTNGDRRITARRTVF